MTQAREEYNILLESGDLKVVLPKASGDWEKDGRVFTLLHESNQKILDRYDNETAEEGPTDLV